MNRIVFDEEQLKPIGELAGPLRLVSARAPALDDLLDQIGVLLDQAEAGNSAADRRLRLALGDGSDELLSGLGSRCLYAVLLARAGRDHEDEDARRTTEPLLIDRFPVLFAASSHYRRHRPADIGELLRELRERFESAQMNFALCELERRTKYLDVALTDLVGCVALCLTALRDGSYRWPSPASGADENAF